MSARRQSPHYIPELDPENGAGVSPRWTMAALLLLGETWLILGLGAVPAAFGLLRDDWPLEVRAPLIFLGVVLSALLTAVFIRTNRPNSQDE